ncbi:MAG TPA: hypothetical protein VGN72_09720 [Tepidisphaeraceae bacterium]|jgi:hypothetical protein|nr:hypothetical protein [Tepidisphaeraceae bacterium]
MSAPRWIGAAAPALAGHYAAGEIGHWLAVNVGTTDVQRFVCHFDLPKDAAIAEARVVLAVNEPTAGIVEWKANTPHLPRVGGFWGYRRVVEAMLCVAPAHEAIVMMTNDRFPGLPWSIHHDGATALYEYFWQPGTTPYRERSRNHPPLRRGVRNLLAADRGHRCRRRRSGARSTYHAATRCWATQTGAGMARRSMRANRVVLVAGGQSVPLGDCAPTRHISPGYTAERCEGDRSPPA